MNFFKTIYKTFGAIIFLALISIPFNASSAPVMITLNNGIMIGIDGIDLGNHGIWDLHIGNTWEEGKFYDENFVYDSADKLVELFTSGIFSGTDVDLGNKQTYGCSSTVSCTIFSATGYSNSLETKVNGAGFTNKFGSNDVFDDVQYAFGTPALELLQDSTNWVYASWSPSTPSAVPVPAAFWLFGSGLIGLIGMARRKKA